MRRRLAMVVAATGALLLLAAPAAFAAEADVAAPDDTVTEPTEIRIEVTPDNRLEPIDGVSLRLEQDDDEVGAPIDLTCLEGCEDDEVDPEDDGRQVWAPDDDTRFDPSTQAPFASGDPLANGDYEFAVEVGHGDFGEPSRSRHEVSLSVAPAAATGVAADADGDGQQVAISWDEGPEPDLVGYRVERDDGDDGDDWTAVADTSETGHVDEPDEGTHRYRVVTIRDDGAGGSLETASDEQEVTLDAADSDDDGDGDTAGDDPEGGDGDRDGDREASDEGNGQGADSGSGGNGAGQVEGDGGAGEGSSSADGGSGRAEDNGTRSASAPSMGGSQSGSIPDLFGDDPETADPDEFSDEIDYDGATNGNGNDEDADDVVLSSPDGGPFDAERVAVPVAVGMVLTATGMHLWRWLKIPMA